MPLLNPDSFQATKLLCSYCLQDMGCDSDNWNNICLKCLSAGGFPKNHVESLKLLRSTGCRIQKNDIRILGPIFLTPNFSACHFLRDKNRSLHFHLTYLV